MVGKKELVLGRLEPVQTYLKNNKRGLGADKIHKVLKPPDPSSVKELTVKELQKKSKGISKKMQEIESKLQEKEFERDFFKEFWPDNV